ncbi:rRNA maturation RNase YbeY [Fontibacter flavus]|uniref:Endoribonuclease YbeY n=1 Tax=Fontibacter flavus TaxID=654838 RepID=A0ABV6FN85_9BACT|nr:rRNA maturation RNase YbeY [Cyclobacteriaceae bacterium]
MAILFFQEDIRFQLKEKNKHKKWLREIAASEGYQIGELNYIFCSDEYLYQINVDYLNHDTYTDIITFDNSEEERSIDGDIFVSVERIQENAKKENITFDKEIHRVMSHGLLHLMGYKDKKKEDKEIMRKMEDKAISMFSM